LAGFLVGLDFGIMKYRSRFSGERSELLILIKKFTRLNSCKANLTGQTMPEETQEEGKLIGKVVHYFSKIEVAVIELTGSLSVGDTIRIAGGEGTDFTQTVESMESEHEKVEKAKKGDSVGVKVKEKVREGYKVYKI
jgi:translation initiation factor IF-2